MVGGAVTCDDCKRELEPEEVSITTTAPHYPNDEAGRRRCVPCYIKHYTAVSNPVLAQHRPEVVR